MSILQPSMDLSGKICFLFLESLDDELQIVDVSG